MAIIAGGAIFVAKRTKRVLFNLRASTSSHPNTWGFFGGTVHTGETVYEGILRECREEMGPLPLILQTIPLERYQSKDSTFEYYTCIIVVEREFIPKLNEESNGYCWVKNGCWPHPLHAGVKNVLTHPSILNMTLDALS